MQMQPLTERHTNNELLPFGLKYDKGLSQASVYSRSNYRKPLGEEHKGPTLQAK